MNKIKHAHSNQETLRASGGCLGDKRRRKTWHSAKSRGEMRAIFDPRVSEWGNPLLKSSTDN